MILLDKIIELSKNYPWITGFVVSLGFGHVVIWLIVKSMWKEAKLKNSGSKGRGFQSGLLGTVERALYTLVIIAGGEALGFIPVWLTLKVASSWRDQNDATTAEGCVRINIFLIGNGLSILFALLGAVIIQPEFIIK